MSCEAAAGGPYAQYPGEGNPLLQGESGCVTCVSHNQADCTRMMKWWIQGVMQNVYAARVRLSVGAGRMRSGYGSLLHMLALRFYTHHSNFALAKEDSVCILLASLHADTLVSKYAGSG